MRYIYLMEQKQKQGLGWPFWIVVAATFIMIEAHYLYSSKVEREINNLELANAKMVNLADDESRGAIKR